MGNRVFVVYATVYWHLTLKPVQDYGVIIPVIRRCRNHLPPVVANNIAFVVGQDNYLHAIDINTGNLIWKFYISTSPLLYQNCTSNFVKRWYRSISIRKWNDTMMPGPYIPQNCFSALAFLAHSLFGFSHFFNCSIILLKLSSPASKFSTISSASSSGSGRLSKSASDLSFIHVI